MQFFSNQEDRSIYFECDRRIRQLFNCRIGNVTSTKDDRLMIRTSRQKKNNRTSRQKSNHRILMFKIMFFLLFTISESNRILVNGTRNIKI